MFGPVYAATSRRPWIRVKLTLTITAAGRALRNASSLPAVWTACEASGCEHIAWPP
jgi:hypothetical protein